MNLHELERLVRKIEDAMDRPIAGPALQKLAADYHAVARAAVTRLNQCGEMIAAGDEHQALQLAESQPPLMDIITLLSFRRSPNWRALCRSENLPQPDAFDLKALRKLNECYARGIDQDHSLYRDYRRAIMLNDDAQALTILRSIVRLNANDQNARAELDRFEKKQRAEKARRLEKLVHAGNAADADEISALATELETERSSPLWKKAQTIRAEVLLARAEEAQKSGNLRETAKLLETLRPLSSLIEPDRSGALDRLAQWTEQEQKRRAEEAGRRAAIDHLQALTARLEQEQLGSQKRPVAELRASLQSLERSWRHVEQFRSQLPAELSSRALRLRDALQVEIGNSMRTSRRLAFASAAAVVLVCLGAAWWGYSRHAARSLASRMEQLVAERAITESESALQSAARYSGSAALEQARAKTTQFLERERALKEAAEREIQKIEAGARQSLTNAPAENIASTFVAARNAIGTAAPDYRAALASKLDAHESAWNGYVERERAARSAQLAAMLGPLEAEAKSQLQFGRAPSEVLTSAQSLRQQLAPALRLRDSEILRPKQEAMFRLETLEAEINKFARDATNFLAAHSALSSATNWSNYNGALQMIISSGFTPAKERDSAAIIAGLNLSSQTLLAPLLLTNGPSTALLEAPRLSQFPNEVLPAEREIQRRLRDDQNIHGIQRLEIEVKAFPTEDPRRRRTVYLRGELQRRITRRAGQIYDPVENPAALNFVQREFGSSEFTVDEPTSTSEKDLYDRVGLNRLLDSNTGKYQTSLLQVLDELNQDRRANPVFRAYLFSRVCEMIDAQPVEWGAIWSPSYNRDRAELWRLGVEQIHSGDWYVPAINSRRAVALVAHFDKAALRSYARESAFFKRLLPAAMQIGARPVGYVSAEGETVVTDLRVDTAVWGIVTPGAPAAIVWENGRPKSKALPFSPLLVFTGNSGQLIDSTLRSLSYSPFAVGIPETLPAILQPNR